MKKNLSKILIIIAVLLLVVAGAVLGIYFFRENQDTDKVISLETDIIENKKSEEQKTEKTIEVAPKKTVKIFSGTERPYAVMIDNHLDALPQAGLNKAYIVYEMIVEGGETRLMALFKDRDLEKIGPIRSSRHYFLDYALENDAIYVHFGWSPQAQADISKLGVNNINGITAGENANAFWRVRDKYAPHNAVTSSLNIIKMAEDRNYSTTSNKKSVLNYVTDEVELTDGQVANSVTIPYSYYNNVKYVYNAETKRYTRYSRDRLQKDWDTQENITTKNIIVTFVQNTTLNDGEDKGRQTLDNVGTKDGYYITNGKAIKIKCKKSSRSSQTVYEDLNGNEIKVNDGNTFIQICPLNAEVEFE